MLRKKWYIIAEGEEIRAHQVLQDMRFPEPIVAALAANGIKRPTPIQVQGIPTVLSGRDMIGIAFTGRARPSPSPAAHHAGPRGGEAHSHRGRRGALRHDSLPIARLARKTWEVLDRYCAALGGETPSPYGDGGDGGGGGGGSSGGCGGGGGGGGGGRAGYPRLRTVLVVGGEDKRGQVEPVQQRGVHCLVATPGRLKDLLQSGKIRLDLCRYLCLDEADRMLDLGFDEEVQAIVSHFRQQRQTLLFSATMPQKFQDFARDVLVRPVMVNVGRAGAANLDVIQEVEYVKQEAKVVYLSVPAEDGAAGAHFLREEAGRG